MVEQFLSPHRKQGLIAYPHRKRQKVFAEIIANNQVRSVPECGTVNSKRAESEKQKVGAAKFDMNFHFQFAAFVKFGISTLRPLFRVDLPSVNYCAALSAWN